MEPARAHSATQPFWLVGLFALAAAGGAVAYVPFLTVLLPLQINRLSGHDDVGALAQVTFAGAVIASLANIGFGMASDATMRRHRWVLAGALCSSAMLVATAFARDVYQLIAIVMVWQFALNMMLAPLLAWAGDCIPDAQKGTYGGLLAFAPLVGALSGSLVTIEGLADHGGRLMIVAVLVVAMVAPVTIFARERERAELMRTPAARDREAAPVEWPVLVMWGARLLVQIAEAGLFAFLLFWLRSLDPRFSENTAANLFSLVLLASVPVALALGRWSDRHRRPVGPLVLCAAVAALGLGVMAFARDIGAGIVGYVVFGIAGTVFLSLHTAQTLRVLPNPRRRGRNLGLFNLTNTIPSLAVPWIAIALVPSFGYGAMFALLALCSALAALALALLGRRLHRS